MRGYPNPKVETVTLPLPRILHCPCWPSHLPHNRRGREARYSLHSPGLRSFHSCSRRPFQLLGGKPSTRCRSVLRLHPSAAAGDRVRGILPGYVASDAAGRAGDPLSRTWDVHRCSHPPRRWRCSFRRRVHQGLGYHLLTGFKCITC